MSKNDYRWTGYFKIVTPKPATAKMVDSQEMTDVGAYNNFTWYQRLVQGSASRMTRYREYDLMDNDIEVSRALDTIAEEMTGNVTKSDEMLNIVYYNEDKDNLQNSTVLTLKAALRKWANLLKLDEKLFSICRITVKYGDCFFRKNKDNDKWIFIHPKNVIAAIVDENDVTKVLAWQIKKDVKAPKPGFGMPLGASKNIEYESEIVPSDEIVWFTLGDDMSDTQPFGESVLRPVYRSHKQKELLEDAIIIYRIQRAPERRVFYIDTGKLHPSRIKTYLENIKNEIRQKKIPTLNGGTSNVDSVYNPHSMSEDFFFAVREGQKGSRVEVLPGGQGLGELSDLEYFQRKVWRGLKVPTSYMIEQQEGGQIWNDGKVGIAYIQEFRFALYIQRLQKNIEKTLDLEFKKFLRHIGMSLDTELFEVKLPEPSNFGKYRQLELDSQLLSSYSSAEGIPYFSKRFIMKRYLQMSEEEIVANERLKKEELGLDPDSNSKEDLIKIYGNPEDVANLGGGMSGGGLGGGIIPAGIGMEETPPELGDEELAGGEIETPTGGGASGEETPQEQEGNEESI